MTTSRSRASWSDDDAEDVRGLLVSGSGADEVCAVTGCEPSDLDRLCRKAFGRDFEGTRRRFQTMGHAMFNKALFEAACGGNAKAMDMYARTRMGYDPVASHGRARRDDGAQGGEKLEL